MLPYPRISAKGRFAALRVRDWIAVEKVHGARALRGGLRRHGGSPGFLGFPELPDNLAEGYVLKPAGEWREWEAEDVCGRPESKVRQQGFAEDGRFDGSRPYLAPPEGAAGVPAWLLVHASALLTPARAASAVSKLGPRTPGGCGSRAVRFRVASGHSDLGFRTAWLTALVSSGWPRTSELSRNWSTEPTGGSLRRAESVMRAVSASAKRSARRTWKGLEW